MLIIPIGHNVNLTMAPLVIILHYFSLSIFFCSPVPLSPCGLSTQPSWTPSVTAYRTRQKDTRQWRPNRRSPRPGAGTWTAGKKVKTSHDQRLWETTQEAWFIFFTTSQQQLNQKYSVLICSLLLSSPSPPHRLASLMRAMAIRILFLRKMSSKMMMTSTMAKMITERQQRNNITHVTQHWCVCVCLCECVYVCCTDWRPAKSVWSAGRWRSLSGSPAAPEWRRILALLSGLRTPCNSGRFLQQQKPHCLMANFTVPAYLLLLSNYETIQVKLKFEGGQKHLSVLHSFSMTGTGWETTMCVCGFWSCACQWGNGGKFWVSECI